MGFPPSNLIAQCAVYLIQIYQIGISPIFGRRCRFSTTCSQYGINSIREFGFLKGIWRTCIRILQCHPLVNKKTFFEHIINTKDMVNMDLQRNFFIIAFLIVSYMLWQAWNVEDHQISNINHHTNNIDDKSYKKSVSLKDLSINVQNNDDVIVNSHIITVKTDVLLLKINTYGGNIEEAYLVKYLENLNSKSPLHLISTSKEYRYQVNSGLTNKHLLDDLKQGKQLIYISDNDQREYVLPKDKNELQLTLIHYGRDVTYIKRYVFNRNDYAINIYYCAYNIGINPIQVQLFGNLTQSIRFDPHSEESHSENNFLLHAYRGSAYSTDKERYQKYSFKDMKRVNLNVNSNGGWIAVLQKYFIAAWLPIIPQKCTFYTEYFDENNISIGFKSNAVYIPSGEKTEFKSILWVGPKIQEKMKLVNPNLDLVIDYGWLWFISQPLFKLLQLIHFYINNWGVSIIVITLIIRIFMYPLTKVQYTSMAKIRMLQPKLLLLQEEYKYDKYQYHQKTIELYKSEKVNPLGGCLPILIQMPIFLALYYMLSGSIELRHSKFALWIYDLSAPDPYYILPIIMGITMFFIQKLSPTTISDPIQKKIMTIMLIVFTVFFLWFPSGLVLYYIASNIIAIMQQQMIYYELSKKNI